MCSTLLLCVKTFLGNETFLMTLIRECGCVTISCALHESKFALEIKNKGCFELTLGGTLTEKLFSFCPNLRYGFCFHCFDGVAHLLTSTQKCS